jgi:hypothetical protein
VNVAAMKEQRTTSTPDARWQAEWVGEERDAEVLRLFAAVFPQPMAPSQWQWKYRHAPERGVLLRRGETPAAFFGGMPRAMHIAGERVLAVQSGDVMVLPSERGVFSRRGALYQAADTFFRERIGPHGKYRVAFGFPSQRHYSLGLKLGLYGPADRMHELRWTALAPQRRLLTRTRPLAREGMAAIEPLWAAMVESWKSHWLPQRDAERFTYRYLDHPVIAYRLLLVSSRLNGNALCALALREHADRIEWLDYVGSREHIPLAVQTMRFQGGTSGKPIMGWFSGAIAPFFAEHASSKPTDVFVPVSAPVFGSLVPPEGKSLWLMGGDTDFL